MSTQLTVSQVAKQLELSRVRVLGLVKAGTLKGVKTYVAGTNIPLVLIEADSLANYEAGRRFTGQRSMIVNLPASELEELQELCAERGWNLRDKNTHNK